MHVCVCVCVHVCRIFRANYLIWEVIISDPCFLQGLYWLERIVITAAAALHSLKTICLEILVQHWSRFPEFTLPKVLLFLLVFLMKNNYPLCQTGPIWLTMETEIMRGGKQSRNKRDSKEKRSEWGNKKMQKHRRDVREGLERLGLSEDKWRGGRGLKMLGERQPWVIVRHSAVWWGLVRSN